MSLCTHVSCFAACLPREWGVGGSLKTPPAPSSSQMNCLNNQLRQLVWAMSSLFSWTNKQICSSRVGTVWRGQEMREERGWRAGMGCYCFQVGPGPFCGERHAQRFQTLSTWSPWADQQGTRVEEGQIPQWGGTPQFLESCSVPSDSPSTLPGPQGSGKPLLILSTLRCSSALNEESCLYLSDNSAQTPLALNQKAYRKMGGPRHAHKSPARRRRGVWYREAGGMGMGAKGTSRVLLE